MDAARGVSPVVPALNVDTLLLNVFQSVEDKAPVVVVFAVAIEIEGVLVPATLIGAVPVTEVTVPDVISDIKATVPVFAGNVTV